MSHTLAYVLQMAFNVDNCIQVHDHYQKLDVLIWFHVVHREYYVAGKECATERCRERKPTDQWCVVDHYFLTQ